MVAAANPGKSSLAGGTISTFLSLPRAANCEIRSLIGRGPEGVLVVPLRCGSWSCVRCAAKKTTIWSHRVEEARPERFVTFTNIGRTRDEIRDGLQHIVRDLRRAGFRFEYWGVVELHKSLLPHLHLLQKGRFIPRELLRKCCEQQGWGHSDIRAVKDAAWTARYCGKHLCHSHGRRWPGRLIRYSRGFFSTTAKEWEASRKQKDTVWEMRHGRADYWAERLRNEGETVKSPDLGEDWIMGEGMVNGDVQWTVARGSSKGYLGKEFLGTKDDESLTDGEYRRLIDSLSREDDVFCDE